MSSFSKQQHLDSLLKFNYYQIQDSIIIPGSSQGNFIGNHTINDTNNSSLPYEIIILLGDTFPSTRPTIILPSYTHKLSKDGQITFEFDKLLGDIVDDIYAELQKNPPERDTLTHVQIKELLADEEEFVKYLHSLDQVVKSREIKENVLIENAKIAGLNTSLSVEKNLTRSEEIKQLKLRIEELQRLNQQHRGTLDSLLYQQQQELIRFGSEYVTEQLRQMVATSDDMTELCATSFLEGKLTEEEFVKAFKESRKLYHMRGIKAEVLRKGL